MAIGTNNGSGANDATTIRTIGREWTQMVIDFDAWVYQSGYSGRIDVLAANDIEPGFGTYPNTVAWLDGFKDAVGLPPATAYLDFGSADGCSATELSEGECLGGWTQENVWFFAAGSGLALAFPEIYLNDGVNAAQWQKVALRSKVIHNQQMIFSGVLVQHAACVSEGCPDDEDNTMVQGWQQLLYALNSDWRTANSLQSSASDIGWVE